MQVKDSLKVKVMPFSDENADSEDQAAGSSAFVELVIPTNSELEGKTLR